MVSGRHLTNWQWVAEWMFYLKPISLHYSQIISNNEHVCSVSAEAGTSVQYMCIKNVLPEPPVIFFWCCLRWETYHLYSKPRNHEMTFVYYCVLLSVPVRRWFITSMFLSLSLFLSRRALPTLWSAPLWPSGYGRGVTVMGEGGQEGAGAAGWGRLHAILPPPLPRPLPIQ